MHSVKMQIHIYEIIDDPVTLEPHIGIGKLEGLPYDGISYSGYFDRFVLWC